MTLNERISLLGYYCELLQSTNSIVEKREIIESIDKNVKDDFDYIIEILAGKHKLGYTFTQSESLLLMPTTYQNYTFREYIAPLFKPVQQHIFTDAYTSVVQKYCQWRTDFVAAVVNRTLRLGIGNSLIDKEISSPMLAKKYEGTLKKDSNGYYVTEKLDGNRCIAFFDGSSWNFISRNGKQMYVEPDMTGLNIDTIYDGEILSTSQTEQSIARTEGKVLNNCDSNAIFNETTGMINKHTLEKNVVYNIFDIVDKNAPYKERREYLNEQSKNCSKDVRILPVLYHYDTADELNNNIDKLLEAMTSNGAEGLMINYGSGLYQQKRTDTLLKFKQIQTMDMKVVDWEYGKGKYEYMIGYLICEATLPDGKKVSCKIGTGISDTQRAEWAQYPNDILGKIVEVAYFSLSQNRNTFGTYTYSLRFPRLKQVRDDKTTTSIY